MSPQIANMHALAKVLFFITSPLMIGLHELQKIVLEGKQEGKLQQISNFQPNWFAYAMWGIYWMLWWLFQDASVMAGLVAGCSSLTPPNIIQLWYGVLARDYTGKAAGILATQPQVLKHHQKKQNCLQKVTARCLSKKKKKFEKEKGKWQRQMDGQPMFWQ